MTHDNHEPVTAISDEDQFVPDGEANGDGPEVPIEAAPESVTDTDRELQLEALVAERTADLQRLQAEYANYRKRVERDRALAKQAGIEQVVTELLPVMDSIELARSHDELTGGFKLVADEITKVAKRYGLEAYGTKGDPFDPQIHEALMQMSMPGITETTCADVMQVGYKLHDRILRPARVAVAEPSADEESPELGDATEPAHDAKEQAAAPDEQDVSSGADAGDDDGVDAGVDED